MYCINRKKTEKIMRNLLLLIAFAGIISACNGNASETAKIDQDSLRMVQQLDSFKRVATADSMAAIAAASAASQRRNNISSTRSSTGTGTQSSTTTTTQKKGWSSAAKGAVIGGVVGAGTGILVDKKDGRGAAIGGVVGAGAGYVIGRDQDKKSGRVNQ